jgi:hypothetical protein
VAQSVGSSASLGLPCNFSFAVTGYLLTCKPVSTDSSLLFLAFGYVFSPGKFLFSHDRVVLYFLINEIHVPTRIVLKIEEKMI